MTVLLSDIEQKTLDLTAELTNNLHQITAWGRTRESDLAELHSHIHSIQNAILAQAAARNYPDKYRLLGGIGSLNNE